MKQFHIKLNEIEVDFVDQLKHKGYRTAEIFRTAIRMLYQYEFKPRKMQKGPRDDVRLPNLTANIKRQLSPEQECKSLPGGEVVNVNGVPHCHWFQEYAPDGKTPQGNEYYKPL